MKPHFESWRHEGRRTWPPSLVAFTSKTLPSDLISSLSPTIHNTRANSTMTTASLIAPFRFIDRIPELRIEVYKLLVVVGKVFYTHDHYDFDEEQRFKDWRGFSAPLLTVLRVSKADPEEAEYVYMSQNIFVLPTAFTSMSPFAQPSSPLNGAAPATNRSSPTARSRS